MAAMSPVGPTDGSETVVSHPACPSEWGNTNQLHCDSSTISIPRGTERCTHREEEKKYKKASS